MTTLSSYNEELKSAEEEDEDEEYEAAATTGKEDKNDEAFLTRAASISSGVILSPEDSSMSA